jgi:hypothetical protein
MMRSIWIAFSTLAVANLLALLGFLVWLHGSDRLNPDRVERVRTIFATTVAQDEAEAAKKMAEAEAAAAMAKEAAKAGTMPLAAEQQLEGRAAKEELDTQTARRVQRETNDLLNTLVREREELERQRGEFQAQVDAFIAMRRRIAEEEGSEQFQKTVQVYQSVKPAEAKNMMNALITAGQKEQVVSYLNALAPRTSSKLIAEFEKDDPAVASDLLERLRLRGTAVAGPGPPAGTPVAALPPEGP